MYFVRGGVGGGNVSFVVDRLQWWIVGIMWKGRPLLKQTGDENIKNHQLWDIVLINVAANSHKSSPAATVAKPA